MFDVLADKLNFSPELLQIMTVWTCWISALFIGPILAFAVTDGAGLRCPLAVLRMVHRIFLVALSLSLAYLAAYVQSERLTLPGPAVLVLMCLFIVTVISGIRHALAPAIPLSNSWRTVGTSAKKVIDRALHRDAGPRSVPRVR